MFGHKVMRYVGNNTFTYINPEPMGEVTDGRIIYKLKFSEMSIYTCFVILVQHILFTRESSLGQQCTVHRHPYWPLKLRWLDFFKILYKHLSKGRNLNGDLDAKLASCIPGLMLCV
jgi:hypothetical protein